jgi:putative glycosyltransferase
MKFSIVTTTYNSTSTIVDFLERMCRAVESIEGDYEIIVVDDGSSDDSVIITRELISQHGKIKSIELSRNFGHHAALLRGMEEAKGAFVFLIDSDLEESPELIKSFHTELVESRSDVIFGVSDKQSANWFLRISSNMFWNLFKRTTKLQIPQGICTVRLMNRRYVSALLGYKEVNLFLAGIWAITGFKQKALVINKVYKGSTSYTIRKRVDLALTSLISFSARPLRTIAALGLGLVLLSFLMLLILLIQYFFNGEAPQGWLSIVTLLIFFGGLQIASIGLVAVYVASILEEVKARPRTIVASIRSSD